MYEEILALIDDAPDETSVAWIAERFGIQQNTVLYAIKSGNLPAEPITDPDGKVLAYRVSPRDALMIWGHRRYRRGA